MSSALDEFRAAPVQSVTLEGVPLRYRTFGSGPSVLCLHGWPLSGVTYRHLIQALAPSYRCIVPDLPGAGASPWNPAITETMTGYARLLHGFVDALQLGRFAIVAHDSGGGAGRSLAAALGARVRCMILQNTELPHQVPWLVRLYQLLTESRLGTALFRRALMVRPLRRSPLCFGGCFGDPDLIESEFFDVSVAPLIADPTGAASMLARLDLGWTSGLPALHAQIPGPIHLFWGGADRFFPLEQARAMQGQFAGGGELHVVPHAKLYVHEEAREELARFCQPLLAAAFEARAGAEPASVA